MSRNQQAASVDADEEKRALDEAKRGVAAAADKDSKGPRIAVRTLFFNANVQMPGEQLCSSLQTGQAFNQKRWSIDYLPRIGMFEVRYSPANKTDEEIRMVPREWASFTPA